MGSTEDVSVEIRGWTAAQLIRRGKKMVRAAPLAVPLNFVPPCHRLTVSPHKISHAYRYILFSYQLLQERRLSDLQAGKSFWFELKAETATTWKYFEDKYRPGYKSLLDNLPATEEEKKAPADAEQLATPEIFHRLLFLYRLPKQQDSYISGLEVEMLELARVAKAVRASYFLFAQPIRAPMQSGL